MKFTYSSLPSEIIFGTYTSNNIASELAKRNYKKVFAITSKRYFNIVRQIEASLIDLSITTFTDVVQHVPKELVDNIFQKFNFDDFDCVLAIGGGSAIGLAKAIAAQQSIAIIAVPTTYSGSEMTPIYGITVNGKKIVNRSNRVKPRLVIYDPNLLESLPKKMSYESAINSLSHLFSALYAPNTNPIVQHLSYLGIENLTKGIDSLDGEKPSAPNTSSLMLGSSVAGKVLGEVQMSLHHKIAHILGGNYNLPHATVHTLLLPHTFEFQKLQIEAQYASVSQILNTEDIRTYFLHKTSSISGINGLRDLGLDKNALNTISKDIISSNPFSPRAISFDSILSLLEEAY